jgi:hypothetical protein
LRVRLLGLPKPGELDEFDFRLFRVGEIYDLTPNLASILLICGYAELAPPLSLSNAADRNAKRLKAGPLPEPEF